MRSVYVRDGNRRTAELTPQIQSCLGLRCPISVSSNGRCATCRSASSSTTTVLADAAGAAGSAARAAGSGVSLAPVSDQLAAYFGVERGALVSSVATDSPAARAGLKAGDVITSMNGRTVADVSDVLEEVRRTDGGASIAITVMRDKKELKLTATMPENPRPVRAGGRSI